MELYNSLIHETEELLSKAAPSHSWDCRPGSEWHDLGSNELVLQKDAAFELGASGKGSANFVLFTSSPIWCRRIKSCSMARISARSTAR